MRAVLWIDDDAVRHVMESGDDNDLVRSSVPFCLSLDNTYCVLVREHDAWLDPTDGWRDANATPPLGRHGRLVLNFYKKQLGEEPGLWFKTFVPLREGEPRIARAGKHACTI
ncbi:MAG: hypothetical protein R3B13_16800 [Polyangiaceae bacterium]